MPGPIGFQEYDITGKDKKFLAGDRPAAVRDTDVIIASGQTAGSSPTFILPAGTVVVKESGNGKYYLADGADGASAGDLNTPAAVTSAEAPDADWVSATFDFTITKPDGTVTVIEDVALDADDDTIAEVVAALNNNAAFAAHLIASDAGAGNELTITTRAKGDVNLRVVCSLDTAFATDDGSTSSDEADGTEADYRVISEMAVLQDIFGTAQDYVVPTLRSGHFDESELSNLSDEAKAVLLRRGSRFS